MDNIPKTDFEPFKKPSSFYKKTSIEYKEKLDLLYSSEWINEYFNDFNNKIDNRTS